MGSTDNLATITSLAEVSRAISAEESLEHVARPFLELLHAISGLESTYLTEIHWDKNTQEIKFSNNQGVIQMPEGLIVDWSDTLCRRSLDAGVRYTDDVPKQFPGSQAAADMNLQTYVSVPVMDRDGEEILGTLCGASGNRTTLDNDVLAVMDMCARLIGEQWNRDQRTAQMARRAERAEEQLVERTTMLAEAEHQLKSPLTVIKGWSKLLSSSWEDLSEDQRKEGVAVISESTERVLRQTEDLIREARSAVLMTKMNAEDQDISPVLRRVAMELSALSVGHTIELDMPAEIRAVVDDQALWQVLSHLVENAIKYSPRGGVVHLRATVENGEVLLTVEDTGLGVPEDIDVFAPFTRSRKSEFLNIAGTGIGLHIVKTLVSSMGGTVSAERNEPVGSTFTVRLATTEFRAPR